MKQDISFGAVILSAGYSSRMGGFKPLLELGGKTLLERQITLFRRIGIEAPLVVIGHRGEEIRSRVVSWGGVPVDNPDYDRGMFSSVRAGAAALVREGKAQGFFLQPVDIPLVPGVVPARAMEHFRCRPSAVTYPLCGGKRGHPPLISAALLPEILAYQGEGGLRAILARYEGEAVGFETGREEILLDMDSPEAYAALKRRYRELQIPTSQECRRLQDQYATPPAAAAHCRRVADTACRLAQVLNKAGASLGVDFIRAAGLLHDMARGRPDHAAAGAEILLQEGYEKLAAVVALHMDIDFEAGGPLDAAALLYLADKMTEGDGIPMTLAERRQRVLKKKGKSPEACRRIAARMDAAERIAQAFEARTGLSALDAAGGG